MAQALSLSSTRTQNYTPADYGELFNHYYDYVQKILLKFGIEQQNLEDVSMSILLKFYENDVLRDYSPTYKRSHNGVEKTATFMTFLSGFVLLYARHYRERQQVMARRLHELPDTDDAVSGSNLFVADEQYGALYRDDLIRTVSAHLNDVPPLPRALVDLSDLFPRVVQQVEETGKISASVLAKEFGVSAETVRTRLKHLRAEVRIALAES